MLQQYHYVKKKHFEVMMGLSFDFTNIQFFSSSNDVGDALDTFDNPFINNTLVYLHILLWPGEHFFMVIDCTWTVFLAVHLVSRCVDSAECGILGKSLFGDHCSTVNRSRSKHFQQDNPQRQSGTSHLMYFPMRIYISPGINLHHTYPDTVSHVNTRLLLALLTHETTQ